MFRPPLSHKRSFVKLEALLSDKHNTQFQALLKEFVSVGVCCEELVNQTVGTTPDNLQDYPRIQKYSRTSMIIAYKIKNIQGYTRFSILCTILDL